jgi:hypothetical protein
VVPLTNVTTSPSLHDGSDFDDAWNVNETDEGGDSEYDSVK